MTMREGQVGGVVLESMTGKPRAVPPAEITRLAEDTARARHGRRRR